MFDLGWSKLIILVMLAIIVVGPKELPELLRTIGRFVAMLRRQADEFSGHVREAFKDTELQKIKDDVANIKQTAEASVRDLTRTVEDSVKPIEDQMQALERGEAMTTTPAADALPPTPESTPALADATPPGHADQPESPPAAKPPQVAAGHEASKAGAA